MIAFLQTMRAGWREAGEDERQDIMALASGIALGAVAVLALLLLP